MADITITAANVVPGASAVTRTGYLGAAATAGQVVYRDPADQSLKLADNNSGTAAARVPCGILLSGGGIGQPATYIESGSVTIGGTLTVGRIYVLSATAGGIAPAADLVTGNDVVILGIATSASVLKVALDVGGIAYA